MQRFRHASRVRFVFLALVVGILLLGFFWFFSQPKPTQAVADLPATRAQTLSPVLSP